MCIIDFVIPNNDFGDIAEYALDLMVMMILLFTSHILLLNSPSFTIEEKDALVEKFICGLHLPLGQNSCCNHDIKIVILATI
jgi:hypothetical protein